jgi:hypothetical protein
MRPCFTQSRQDCLNAAVDELIDEDCVARFDENGKRGEMRERRGLSNGDRRSEDALEQFLELAVKRRGDIGSRTRELGTEALNGVTRRVLDALIRLQSNVGT